MQTMNSSAPCTAPIWQIIFKRTRKLRDPSTCLFGPPQRNVRLQLNKPALFREGCAWPLWWFSQPPDKQAQVKNILCLPNRTICGTKLIPVIMSLLHHPDLRVATRDIVVLVYSSIRHSARVIGAQVLCDYSRPWKIAVQLHINIIKFGVE